MVLRQPSYKLILVFLSATVISIPATLLRDPHASFGNLLEAFLYSTLLLGGSVTLLLLLFWYWNVTKTIIDESTKMVTIIVCRFHFFKIKEFKFNGQEVWLEIKRIYYWAGDGDGYAWRLFLRHPTMSRFLIMESVFGGMLIKKAKEIQAILNCRIENPCEKPIINKQK